MAFVYSHFPGISTLGIMHTTLILTIDNNSTLESCGDHYCFYIACTLCPASKGNKKDEGHDEMAGHHPRAASQCVQKTSSSRGPSDPLSSPRHHKNHAYSVLRKCSSGVPLNLFAFYIWKVPEGQSTQLINC